MEIERINSVGMTGGINRIQNPEDKTSRATLEAAAEVSDFLHLSSDAREKARMSTSDKTESSSPLFQYFYNILQVQLSKNSPISKTLKSIKNYFDKAAKFFGKGKNKGNSPDGNPELQQNQKEEGLVITLTDEHLSMLKREDAMKTEKGHIYEYYHRGNPEEQKGTLVNYKV